MAPNTKDARVLILATVGVVVAGLVVVGVLLLATGRREQPGTYKPFPYGEERDLIRTLEDGGPFYVPDPFGGNRSILWALEDGAPVALTIHAEDDASCRVTWKGRIESFVDCHDTQLTSRQIPRYEIEIPRSGPNEDIVLVDLRREISAPDPS
jgi:hypothetical protein